MKSYPFIFFLLVVTAMISCGKSAAEKDAEAVCDCLSKAQNGSVEAKAKCLEQQRTSGEKYLDNPDDLKTFNETVTPCILETINNK